MAALLLALTACDHPEGAAQFPVFAGNPAASAKPEAVATFAEGCFWHSEIVFQSLKGVRDAVSGYAGGRDRAPDYETVSSGTTGHAESVQVYYDPAVVSFQTLVRAFLASQDPTQVDGQGYDRGSQYRSIAFYRTPAEKAIIEAELARLKASGQYKKPLAVQVLPYTTFYPAEAYHQEFIRRNPGQSYVRSVSIPDYERFRRAFPGPYKDSTSHP